MSNGESLPTLLPLLPSREQRQELISNILAVYERATARQRSEGMAWYNNAHSLAEIVGDGDITKGAGILAALSANTSWDRNSKLALLLADGLRIKHFNQVLRKVEAIMKGAPVLATLGRGPKTQAFYLNIAHPDTPGAVTVDRHAHDIARNQVWGTKDRGLSSVKRYNILADAYADAATLAGIRPHEMQAITWVVWREERHASKD